MSFASFEMAFFCGATAAALSTSVQRHHLDGVNIDIAAGEDASEQLGQFVPLRDRERSRRAALIEAAAPCASGRRILDAEERTVRV